MGKPDCEQKAPKKAQSQQPSFSPKFTWCVMLTHQDINLTRAEAQLRTKGMVKTDWIAGKKPAILRKH